MAHNQSLLKKMGPLVSNLSPDRIEEAFEQYQQLLLEILSHQKSVKNNFNTLLHIYGYFKTDLTEEEKSELMEVLENYHRELTPLLVPLTLIKHFSRKYKKEYLLSQHYLNPHPIELKLLNHV